MFYKQLKEQFLQLAKKNHLLDKEIIVKTQILKPAEAIGNPDRNDFPLLKGREVLMEAVFMKMKGQSYTDSPSEFFGYMKEIIYLPLSDSRQKALFVAALNAAVKCVYSDTATIHCKNNEPEECSKKITEFIQRLNPTSLGLIGFQPAILNVLTKTWGTENVACVDRDEDNRGQIKYGIRIGWGDNDGMDDMFKRSDVVLATGSSVVNASLPEILTIAETYNKPVYFYGTTIAGTARLMGLNRLCFKAN